MSTGGSFTYGSQDIRTARQTVGFGDNSNSQYGVLGFLGRRPRHTMGPRNCPRTYGTLS